MPLLLWLTLLPLEPAPPPELDLLLVCGLRFEEPLLAREALLRPRVEAADFERDEPPDERGEPLRDAALPEREDPLAFVFEPELFDEPLLPCPLREADLLAAIRDTPPIETIPPADVPIWDRNNPYVQVIADGVRWPPWAPSTTS